MTAESETLAEPEVRRLWFLAAAITATPSLTTKLIECVLKNPGSSAYTNIVREVGHRLHLMAKYESLTLQTVRLVQVALAGETHPNRRTMGRLLGEAIKDMVPK
ncbi:MAG: hypothetical protein WDO70_08425 [Alphaproteobacteria bacterium]